MPYFETTDELAGHIADLVGVYGGHDDDETKSCRVCFVDDMEGRIRRAVENEYRITFPSLLSVPPPPSRIDSGFAAFVEGAKKGVEYSGIVSQCEDAEQMANKFTDILMEWWHTRRVLSDLLATPDCYRRATQSTRPYQRRGGA